MSDAPLRIARGALSAAIAPTGAELQDLRDGSGRLLQWTGDPSVWSGRAPVLFPIVGELAHGHYRLGDRTYALPRHGFARRSTFDVVSHETDATTLRLVANDETRAVYPFEFALAIEYALVEDELRIVATVTNAGDAPMPASFGFHPAFAWPLPYGADRADHTIRFAADEPAPVRRLDVAGLVTPSSHATPIVGRTLALDDALFAGDALVLDRVASRTVSYGASTGPRIEVRFDGFPMLGLWSKPGARFVCIEPWQGCADPEGFEGTLFDKPGVVVLAPGASRVFRMTVALVDG